MRPRYILHELTLGLLIFIFDIRRSTILAGTRSRYCQLFLQFSAVFAYQVDNDTHVFLHLTALTIIHLIPIFCIRKEKRDKNQADIVTAIEKFN